MSNARDGLPCLIGSKRFLVELDQVSWQTMKPTRQGVDQGASASEQSLSTEVVWRRRRDNWVGGAGQEYADLVDDVDESSPIRFNTSDSIDPWTRRALTVGRPRKFLHHLPRAVTEFTLSESTGRTQLGATETWLWMQVRPDDYGASPEVSTPFENGVLKLVLGNSTMPPDPYLTLYVDTTAAGTYDESVTQGLGVDWGKAQGGLIGAWVRQNGADIDVNLYAYGAGDLNVGPEVMVSLGATVKIVGKTLGVAAGDAIVRGPRFGAGYGTPIASFGDKAGATASIEVKTHNGAHWLTSDTVAADGVMTRTGTGFDNSVITSATALDGSRFGGVFPVVTDNAEYATSVGVTEYKLIAAAGNVIQDLKVNLATGAVTVTAEAMIGPPEIISACSDGAFTVYVADEAGYVWSGNGTAMTRLGTELAEGVAIANGRLLAWLDGAIFELSSSGVRTSIMSAASASFRWGGAVATPGGIYAWGRAGVTSSIYLLPISETDGSIDPGIVAAPVPAGEYVYDMLYHLGVMVLATNKGLRLATINADGSLSFGPLLDDLGPSTGVTALGTDVYVVTTTGAVWRIDPSRFTATLQPAYAAESSLIYNTPVTPAPHVVEVPTRITVQADESASLVLAASQHLLYGYPRLDGTVVQVAGVGEIDLGWFTYGIGEPLALDSVTVECEPHDGLSAWQVRVRVDTPDTEAVIDKTLDFTAGSVLLAKAVGDVRARRFRVRLTLTADRTRGTAPTVREVVLRAAPAPFLSDEMLIPLILRDQVADEFGQVSSLDVFEEFTYLLGLRDSRERVPFELGGYSATVRVEDVTVQSGGLGGGNGIDGWDMDHDWLAGRWEVRLVTLET